MKRLILMRHAKSDWSLDQSDFDRPLNPRGRAAARTLGDWLRTQNLAPDEVLCSSARRTRETLAGLAIEAEERFERALYLADPGTILDILGRASGNTVLLIGHNPGVAMLAEGLSATAPDHPRFMDYPTGATLVADFDIEHWGQIQTGTGQVQRFVIPKELTE